VGGEETEEVVVLLKRFFQADEGQDLVEYTLLLAFVVLATAALFIGSGGAIEGIWNTTNARLQKGNAAVS
jgi:Flp pilus assembly pilin Flp